MPQNQRYAEFYRFHDQVAFHFTETGTMYLSADFARRVAGQLVTVADDIDAKKFTKSTLTTVRIIDTKEVAE